MSVASAPGGPPDGHVWWEPILHFVIHSVVGSAIFIVVALPAWGLGHLVHWLKTDGTAPYVIGVLTALEYIIITVDGALFVAYLVYAAVKAAKEFR